MAGDSPPCVPAYDLNSPCYGQFSLAGRGRDVVQTLTCRGEIIVPNEKLTHVNNWVRIRSHVKKVKLDHPVND